MEPDQWGVTAIGEQLGRVPSASSVVIAVIDSGVDSGHPDFIDSVTNQPKIKSINCHPDHSDGEDDDGHGTHCIGTIAAEGRNGFGVRGVCRPRDVYSYRIFSPFDSGAYYEALDKAVHEDGANIISLSLAGDFDQTESNLISDAVKNQGVVFCCAAGNDGQTIERFPAALAAKVDGVIAVGAMTLARQVAGFSNVGKFLTLVAPGKDIVSTYPRNKQPRRMDSGFPFEIMDGTSMATPFVAGAAAILKHNNPGFTPQQIRNTLCIGARLLSGQSSRTDAAGAGCVSV